MGLQIKKPAKDELDWDALNKRAVEQQETKYRDSLQRMGLRPDLIEEQVRARKQIEHRCVQPEGPTPEMGVGTTWTCDECGASKTVVIGAVSYETGLPAKVWRNLPRRSAFVDLTAMRSA